jgi:nicotinamidase/pyrazinamidase
MTARIQFDPPTTALLVVDLQPDFLPGGALAVGGGDEVLEPIRDLMERAPFGLCVATQDWHPPGHISFASSHPGREPLDVIELYGREQVLWPDHCVQGTPGAELHRAMPWHRVSAIIRKGVDPRVDSYSTFRNNWDPDGRRPPTGLTGYLMERGITDVVICGLARDYCVKWSAEDAAEAGFRTFVVWELSRPVDPAADDDVLRALIRAGVKIVTPEQLADG